MTRIPPVDRNAAEPGVAELLDAVKKKLGVVPNLVSTLAQSPAAAQAYLGMSGALAKGRLPARLREQIALVVGETNSCAYCVAAHTALGQGAGMTEQQTCDARRATSDDPKEQAALTFTREVVVRRGLVDDGDVRTLRDAGYTDGDICEIVAHVAMNIFTNYFNHVAQTEIDFPVAPALASAS